jgi:hypothetical protein
VTKLQSPVGKAAKSNRRLHAMNTTAYKRYDVRLHLAMTIYQMFTLLFAVSLPIAVLVIVGRHVVSAFRSLKDRQFKFALISVLAIAGFLSLFAGVAVVWFAYGVAHTKKGILEDLMLLTVSGIIIYGGGYGLWRLARFLDGKPSGDAA